MVIIIDKKHMHPPMPPELKNENYREMSVSMLIRTLEHIHGQRIRSELENIGVFRAYGPILTELSAREGISQSELANKFHFRASSISVTIQKMTESGYVRKENDKSDARQTNLFLTDKGRALTKKINETFIKLEDELISPLNDEEASELRRILEKLILSEKEKHI